MINENEILELFNHGDHKAFAYVFNLHFKNLCYFAYSIIKDNDSAKEIALISFEATYEKVGSFQALSKIKSYLYATTRNQCIDWIKKRQHVSDIDYLDEASCSEESIMSQIIRIEFIQSVYTEIESLPKTRRNVFKMLYLEGRTNAEVAKALNIHIDAVYNNKLKALKQLRNSLFNKKLLP